MHFKLYSSMSEKRKLASDLIFPGSVISNLDYQTHLSRYVFISRLVGGKDVLDIGCGTGYGTSYLLRK